MNMPQPFHRSTAGAAALFAFLLLNPLPSRAEVPLPDQIIYGTIAIQNRGVTNSAAGANVVIEARRASNGGLLASYRMGSTPAVGPMFYALRVPMEEAPASTAEFAEPGEDLVLTVRRQNVVEFTSTNVPAASGDVLRLDFGASVDTDGNGVPDGWELRYFGVTGIDLSADSDQDGVSNYLEYLAGTSPVDPDDVFHLDITVDSEEAQVSFLARAAAGAGYEGRTRYY
ncbi:MAG: hypothetical protein KIT22_19255, partial [Verrucomicrobiae bacterium]|nr:hypothetical protein [Verrucomicrobiae bacterium]